MTTEQQTGQQDSDAAFTELLGKAGPRITPPADDERIVRDAVQAEWQRVAARRVRQKRMLSFAMAASVVLAVFVGLNLLRDNAPAIEERTLATVVRHHGDITIRDADGATRSVPAAINGSAVVSIQGSDRIVTGDDAGLALAWHGGGSLRIDAGTVVVFDAQDRIYLQQGRVYFDSVANPVDAAAKSAGPADFGIRTDRGIVRHLGTQYMTAVDDASLVVTVREGIVSVDAGAVNARASAGKQLRVVAQGGPEIDDVDTYGDQWAWVERAGPAVDLGGRRVIEALRWVSRETGRDIEFASEEAERLATETALVGLQGDLGMRPSRALDLFMLTVDLEARIEGGKIIVNKAGP